jgi:hypothetical protein
MNSLVCSTVFSPSMFHIILNLCELDESINDNKIRNYPIFL